MPRNRSTEPVIAIAVTTTGPNPSRHRLRALAACMFREGTAVARFEATIEPEGTAGGDHRTLAGDALPGPTAPPIAAWQRDFLAFLPEDGLCVAHDADLVRAFLRRATGGAFRTPLVDSLRLCWLCLPELASHELAVLRSVLELDVPLDAGGPAGVAAATTGLVWYALQEIRAGFPAAALAAVLRLLQPLRGDALRSLLRAGFRPADGSGSAPLAHLFREGGGARRSSSGGGADPECIDADAVAAVFGPDGGLAAALASYEPRREQASMARAVVDAFNDSRHLLVEAGTGTGKSLAYLVPAVLWSLVNHSPVVVSTHTRNLQEQLHAKDLPLVARALNTEFRTALIKGRRNYLCIRRLLYLLEHADTELEPEDRYPLASVVLWAVRTCSGDLAESLLAERHRFRELAGRLASVAEECSGPACPCYRRCFLQRARRQALAADVIVANHAVVFAEMANPLASPVLPPHEHLVLDEAQNLEDAVTSALTREVSLRRILFVLGRLCRPGRRGTRRGLLPSLTALLRRGDRGLPGPEIEAAADASEALMGMVEAARAATGPFFLALARLLPRDPGLQTRRLRPLPAAADARRDLELDRQRLATVVGLVAAEAAAVADRLGGVPGGTAPALRLEEFARELRAGALWAREFVADTARVLDAEDPNAVSWIERVPPAQGSARAWSAPVAVGPLLAEPLYGAKRSVILTSATLTVRGEAGFMRERLGLDLLPPERLRQLALGTPFRYGTDQCLVLVPTFLPEPGDPERDYTRELAAFMGKLFRRTRGRAMGLFTSHDMLRRCAALLRDDPDMTELRLLAQGIHGSRQAIRQLFAASAGAVLLGTHSFWEGVDITGEALSCVLLARLPFPVHTDPVVEARCEALAGRGLDPFRAYSLPLAVIRFRQGFGRLIRHRNDRGVVLVADRRIVTKRYGEWFRQSIPATVYTCGNPEDLLEGVSDFLDRAPASPPTRTAPRHPPTRADP
ncbi:MAG: hypothetical protein JXR77_08440 [Lentisphaeria bacterium]|nr:hypothetical protein [Lentisphaeria bacterium]